MEQNYKVQPFDLDTALANPDWVYFRSGEKPLEWHWFKNATSSSYSITAIDERGEKRDVTKQGIYYLPSKSEHDYDLVLHVPVKKMKITVFVWANGATLSYSESERKSPLFDTYCQQAEQGKCTRHEFEVELNEPQP